MSTKFMVNGKEKSLEMRDKNGIDWSADFIATGEQDWECDDDGRYIVTQEDFEWWQETIASHEHMDAVIAAYKEQFDPDEVNKVVQDWVGNDLETTPAQVIHGLEQAFGAIK